MRYLRGSGAPWKFRTAFVRYCRAHLCWPECVAPSEVWEAEVSQEEREGYFDYEDVAYYGYDDRPIVEEHGSIVVDGTRFYYAWARGCGVCFSKQSSTERG